MFDMFKKIQKPFSVISSNISTSSFSKKDVAEILHLYDDEEQSIGIFKLSDGRFASIFHRKEPLIIIDNQIINDSITYVAPSYDHIIKLGLTNETRDLLRINGSLQR